MQTEEQKRIRDYIMGELPLKGSYLFFRTNTENPFEKLSLVKDVLSVVSQFNEDNWPSDEQWDLLLPKWFLFKIKSHSLEEITKNSTLLWDYGSWLDAMKYRGWEWYSSKIDISGFTIILEPHTYPFSVNPFEYIIFETGVALGNISFEDHSR